MNKGNKYILYVAVIFAALLIVMTGVGLYFISSLALDDVDTVAINDVYNAVQKGDYIESKYDYTYMDSDGKVIFSTVTTDDMGYDVRLNDAIKHGYPVKEVGDGRIIFYTSYGEDIDAFRCRMAVIISVSGAIILLVMTAYIVYIYCQFIRPFAKLERFAVGVAGGNLDIPLDMTRYNNFGAFEEAFDIMRTNLLTEKRRAEKAEADKRTLMAEIGHDIKTPLASIRAVSENALLKRDDDSYRIIIDKTSKIENLINDIYHGTLDEIGELGVMLKNHPISDVYGIIRVVDYNGYTNIKDSLKGVILTFDSLRLTQVIENIIINSYKYADTEIDVHTEDRGESVRFVFKDYGGGVGEDEIAHILDRFYRGEKVKESNGQGLGLYISRKLMMKMGGMLTVYNDSGFAVAIDIAKSSGDSGHQSSILTE